MNSLFSIENPPVEDFFSLKNLSQDDLYRFQRDQFSENTFINTHFNIVIVGAGGTGGYVIRDVSRYLYSIKERNDEFSFSFHIYDPDLVEHKNLMRQNFLPQDLGKPKAEVLAERHSKAFGIEIIAHNSLFSSFCTDHTTFPSNKSHRQTIIVGCVDNNKGRREINRALENMRSSSNSNVFWIDSGNERKTGQVILGGYVGDRYSRINRQFKIPTVTDIYPEVLDPTEDTESVVSCAERLMRDEQNIFVNATASTHVFNFVRKIIQMEPISIHGVRFNIDGKVDSFFLKEEQDECIK